jgi:hypothetical protein
MKMKSILVFAVLALSLIGIMAEGAEPAPGQRFKKVIWVVFENTNYAAAIRQPDFARAASQGALLTQLSAESHPSQGNYIAMIAGSTLGVHSDNNVNLNQSHVGDLLEKAGLDWRVYAEDYPGNCFVGATAGLYARKHVPFLSFIDVNRDSSRCQKIVPSSSFGVDFQSGNLPAYSLYIPNLKNDGHNTGVDYAGKWLTAKFGNVFRVPSALQDTLFIFTFDESGSGSSNQIYTLLIGGSVIPGSQNNQQLSHEALLKLIEDEFNLGNLGRNDSTAPEISGIWR